MRFNFKTVLLPLLLLLGGLLIWVSFPGLFHPAQETTKPTPAEDDFAKAAVIQGVKAFFTIDEQADSNAWSESVCKASTKSGCAFYKLGSARLWKQFTSAHMSITPTVRSIEKVTVSSIKYGQQVWKAEIELSRPLPGRSNSKDTAYVLAIFEEGVWKFDRFLTPEEVKGLTK